MLSLVGRAYYGGLGNSSSRRFEAMIDTPDKAPVSSLAPFRHSTFRAIWVASLASNFGGLIQAVGAAWMMTSITNSAGMVALVQASTSLPIMLFSLASGAIADNFNRRRVMLVAQAFMLLVSAGLTVFAYLGLITPWLLLRFTFLIGCGVALNNPSWQASVGDIVPRSDLPAAVALNSVGFNLTRSVGPAIGGAIVAAAGAAAAFAVNTVSYLALLFVLGRWRPVEQASTLPRETLGTAMTAGLRYVAMSPNIEKVLLRSFAFGLTAISILALLPLVARDLLQGGPLVYGIMLGCFGIGAIGGAFLSGRLRQRMTVECDSPAGLYRLCLLRVVPGRGVEPLAGRPRADDRRRLLGAGLVSVQCHRAAFDAALGGRPGAFDLPDGHLRRHGLGQLAVGLGCRGIRTRQGVARLLRAVAGRCRRLG